MTFLLYRVTILSVLFLATLITLPLFTPAFASHILFQDDFELGNANQWTVKNGNWTVQNIDGSKRYGSTVNAPFTVVETTAGSTEWTNYIFELDFIAKQGEDKNVIFRVVDNNTRYGLHMRSDIISLEKWLPSEVTEIIEPASFVNNTTYHLKIMVNGQNIKVYANNILLIDHTDINNPITHGKIGLKVGTGAVFPTEIWFDNIIVTGIDNILSVPLFKQTGEPWQSNIYDAANIWSPSTANIYNWGCAITSAAMVLKYHGINKLPDGIDLDPGSLNNWLKSQSDGYIGNGNTNWNAITRLSRLAKDINGITSFDALEYTRIGGENKPQLTTDLQNSMPDILEEPGHFIVGTGISDNTFTINDPFHTRTLLTDGYGNSFLSLRKFTPSFTDLSYLMLVVPQDTQISLVDQFGNPVGESFIQEPIIDPSTNQSAGPPVKILELAKPQSGNYNIVISGSSSQTYHLDLYLYDQDANVNVATQSGVISPNAPETVALNFNQQEASASSIQKLITFQSTIDDINEARAVNLITRESLKERLVRIVTQAQGLLERGKSQLAFGKLNKFEKILNRERGEIIAEEAYQILIEDVNYLKTHL